MTQSKSWEQVGKKFDSLGTQLRARLEEASKDAAADRVALEKAFKSLLSALEDTINAATKVVTDPAVRKEFTELAASMRTALLDALETFRAQSLTATRRRAAAGGTALRRVAKPAERKGAAPKATTVKAVPHRAVARKPAAGKRSSA